MDQKHFSVNNRNWTGVLQSTLMYGIKRLSFYWFLFAGTRWEKLPCVLWNVGRFRNRTERILWFANSRQVLLLKPGHYFFQPILTSYYLFVKIMSIISGVLSNVYILCHTLWILLQNDKIMKICPTYLFNQPLTNFSDAHSHITINSVRYHFKYPMCGLGFLWTDSTAYSDSYGQSYTILPR